MSKLTEKSTLIKLTDEIQEAYNAVLLRIVHDLEKDQREELRFYYKGRIPGDVSSMLSLVRSLENSMITSWIDVRSLKRALNVVQRLDLEKSLTSFEIKRDLSVLLYCYASMRQGLEPNCPSPSVESLAGYLMKITAGLAVDGYDKKHLALLIESRKTARQVLIDFEKAIKQKSWDQWSKLTFLVIVAGVIVAEALTNEEHCQKPEATKLCLAAAEELCSRLTKLGSWDDFFDHVEKRHNEVYHQQGSDVCGDVTSFSVEERVIAKVVQQLADTEFFCSRQTFN